MERQIKGLYDPQFEHDACGIASVVNIKGKQSRQIVDYALKVIENLDHRAGKDATGETGDGVGIMLQVSHSFFSRAAAECGINVGGPGDYGVGMFFFPQDAGERDRAKAAFEAIVRGEGFQCLGWRDMPTNPDTLGQRARSTMPHIAQCFIARPASVEKGLPFDRRLYIARRLFEKSQEGAQTYVVSLSSRTVVYKGMFLVRQLRDFYDDLQSEDFQSALALVHSRYSTNTNPTWERSHPNRFICHNGEINTIRGNVDKMLAREAAFSSSVLKDEINKVFPVINLSGSDSAMLDNTLEFLMMNGMDLPLAMMVVIPEPWRYDVNISRSRRDCFHYYSTMMEPWDGPASILCSDGEKVGAIIDRNGLRPSRFYITSDDMLVLSSEVGVLDIPPEKIVKKGHLYSGRMLVVDTAKGTLMLDENCKEYYASRNPYGEWVFQHVVNLKDLPIPNKNVEYHMDRQRARLYKAFGYTYEEVKNAILPMAINGKESTSSMGIDIPLAVLSEKRQPLFNYFKQLFAQVTNPPLDSLREKIITDTTVYAGSAGNILEEEPENCAVLEIHNPILTGTDMMKIKSIKREGFKTATVSLLYDKNTPLEQVMEDLFLRCEQACRGGANIIVLSDRGVDENRMAIPSLLAVSGVEQYFVRTRKSTAVSIILESGEPRDVHHFATLLGYGACAVNPYLAHECIKECVEAGVLDKDYYKAVEDYNAAILRGIVHIASKMGISTVQSYQNAKLFEAVGIKRSVIDKYFTNTVSRVGGIGLEEIDEDVRYRHSRAFALPTRRDDMGMDSLGIHKMCIGEDKEEHLYNPRTIIALREATQTGNYQRFKEYTRMIDDENRPYTLRGLLDFAYREDGGIPIEEVEPVESIVRRFKTGAMSYGSISQEAHECLAIAMNRLGGKSNSGEGGEMPERLGTERNSAIKQVASGRFGVTSEYLVSAREIQIKMAQGAKPGEGGHLPGEKVYPWVAKTRHSTPGVSLISPPPHHDIYSIEDLAQLIYDLKNANCNADISVKLVAEAGVGTIAAGVAKAGAQVILISGYDGGTGAAPQSSIHNAGLPWELGLAEAHQTLIQNGLRTRVRLETDGKLMTGRDVAIAAMLGAEEFGFATAPLVTVGCLMMRVCNLDTCPVGVATQNPMLRKRFCGKPEYVMNFMRFVAQELREIMARLGVRTVDELVGRTDLLTARKGLKNKRADSVDMSLILNHGEGANVHFEPSDVYDFKLEETADSRVLFEEFKENLEPGQKKAIEMKVSNTDRTFGTLFGAEVTRRFGNTLSDDTFTVKCTGSGGQSFGAFIPKGLTLELEGDSNDYFGKGLSGGKLIV
ncbi:MAG: glutamate synthase large subunit, partial [Christensenellales bacterium]